MKRLTKKIFYDQTPNYNPECIEKLIKLEDIEEKIGIELTTLFDATEKGIYVKRKSGYIDHYNSISVDLAHKVLIYSYSYYEMSGYDSGSIEFRFEDYGTKWVVNEKDFVDYKPEDITQPSISQFKTTDTDGGIQNENN